MLELHFLLTNTSEDMTLFSSCRSQCVVMLPSVAGFLMDAFYRCCPPSQGMSLLFPEQSSHFVHDKRKMLQDRRPCLFPAAEEQHIELK